MLLMSFSYHTLFSIGITISPHALESFIYHDRIVQCHYYFITRPRNLLFTMILFPIGITISPHTLEVLYLP